MWDLLLIIPLTWYPIINYLYKILSVCLWQSHHLLPQQLLPACGGHCTRSPIANWRRSQWWLQIWLDKHRQTRLKDGEKLKIPKSYIKSHCDRLPSLFTFERNAPTSWNDPGPSIPQAPGPSPFPGPSRKRMVLYKGPSVMQWPRLRPAGYELGNWGLNMDKSFSSRNRKRKHMTKHCSHGTLSNGEGTSRIQTGDASHLSLDLHPTCYMPGWFRLSARCHEITWRGWRCEFHRSSSHMFFGHVSMSNKCQRLWIPIYPQKSWSWTTENQVQAPKQPDAKTRRKGSSRSIVGPKTWIQVFLNMVNLG